MLHEEDPAARLQHFRFEVKTLDDVTRTYRFAHSQIGMGPGRQRHGNCHTVNVERTLFGFAVDYGQGHRRADDAAHQVLTYMAAEGIDPWGGKPQATSELD